MFDCCADCGGFDIEIMRPCSNHKGVEVCRGCECPFCAEDEQLESEQAHRENFYEFEEQQS